MVEEGVSAGLGVILSSGAGLAGAGVIGAGVIGAGVIGAGVVAGGLSLVRMAGSEPGRLVSMGSQPANASSEAAINAETAIEVEVCITVISKSDFAHRNHSRTSQDVCTCYAKPRNPPCRVFASSKRTS